MVSPSFEVYTVINFILTMFVGYIMLFTHYIPIIFRSISISQDFLKLASTKNGLIYPVEEERRALGQDGAGNPGYELIPMILHL